MPLSAESADLALAVQKAALEGDDLLDPGVPCLQTEGAPVDLDVGPPHIGGVGDAAAQTRDVEVHPGAENHHQDGHDGHPPAAALEHLVGLG